MTSKELAQLKPGTPLLAVKIWRKHGQLCYWPEPRRGTFLQYNSDTPHGVLVEVGGHVIGFEPLEVWQAH